MSKNGKAAYTIREFCAAYGISPAHTYRLIQAGKLIPRKTGNRTLISHSEAERWFSTLPEGVSR